MSSESSRCLADAVLAVDAWGVVGYVNLAVELATGRARRDLLGQSLASVFGTSEGEADQSARTLARRAMRENCRVGPGGDVVLDQWGEIRSAVECWAAPVHDRNGVVVGAILVFYSRHPAALARRESAATRLHSRSASLNGMPPLASSG